MRTTLKRLLIWLYCRGLIPARMVAWAFRFFELSEV